MVAVNYQRPPYSVFSLNPGANITQPKDMVGKEFSAGNASLIPRIHQAFMKQNGLDPSTLKLVNLDPASLVAALASRKIQSIGLFAMSETAIRRAVKDAEVKMAHMLVDTLAGYAGAPAAALAQRIEQTVGDWLGGREHDDIAVLIIQAKPSHKRRHLTGVPSL